jgi:hypothetical protein
MPIITISRGCYSRGKEVAEKVAKELGYQCLSREILLEASDKIFPMFSRFVSLPTWNTESRKK